MKIIINEPVTDRGHIFICNTEADIKVNATLISTAGKVYILGKTVVVNSNVKSEKSDVKICGIEELTTSDHLTSKARGGSQLVSSVRCPIKTICQGMLSSSSEISFKY